MKDKFVRFGEKRYQIKEWDYGTNEVVVDPSDGDGNELAALLKRALVNRDPLLYYPASEEFAVSENTPSDAKPRSQKK